MKARVEIQSLDNLNSKGHEFSFNPDATTIAVAANNDVKVWRVEDGILLKTLSGGGYINHIAYSPDGSLLFVSTYNRTFVWNAKTYELAKEIDTFRGYPGIFSNDTRFLLIYSNYGEGVEIWNTNSWSRVKERVSIDTIKHVVEYPQRAAFMIVTDKGLVSLSDPGWDLKPVNLKTSLNVENISTISISSSANFIALAEKHTNNIHILDKRSKATTKPLIGHDDQVCSLYWLDDEKTIISNSIKGDVIFWRVSDGVIITRLTGLENVIWSLRKPIAAANSDKTKIIRVIGLDTLYKGISEDDINPSENHEEQKSEDLLNIEAILATVTELLASEGRAKEVGILAHAEAILKQTDYDNWDGGVYIYTLYLQVPAWLYTQVSSGKEESEEKILAYIDSLTTPFPRDHIRRVLISPQATEDNHWRDKAKAWVAGTGVTNQGRVRSDNIAPRECDGLLFRSESEIYLYKALKSLGVSFAPLPVFIKGGESYRRIEPDFVVIKDGIVMVIEVDGDTVHQETPEEAHNRTTMLVHEGAHVERIKASECGTTEKADISAKKLLQIITKLKLSR